MARKTQLAKTSIQANYVKTYVSPPIKNTVDMKRNVIPSTLSVNQEKMDFARIAITSPTIHALKAIRMKPFSLVHPVLMVTGEFYVRKIVKMNIKKTILQSKSPIAKIPLKATKSLFAIRQMAKSSIAVNAKMVITAIRKAKTKTAEGNVSDS